MKKPVYAVYRFSNTTRRWSLVMVVNDELLSAYASLDRWMTTVFSADPFIDIRRIA